MTSIPLLLGGLLLTSPNGVSAVKTVPLSQSFAQYATAEYVGGVFWVSSGDGEMWSFDGDGRGVPSTLPDRAAPERFFAAGKSVDVLAGHRIYRAKGTNWEPLLDFPASVRPGWVVPARDGYVLRGNDGKLVYFAPGAEGVPLDLRSEPGHECAFLDDSARLVTVTEESFVVVQDDPYELSVVDMAGTCRRLKVEEEGVGSPEDTEFVLAALKIAGYKDEPLRRSTKTARAYYRDGRLSVYRRLKVVATINGVDVTVPTMFIDVLDLHGGRMIERVPLRRMAENGALVGLKDRTGYVLYRNGTGDPGSSSLAFMDLVGSVTAQSHGGGVK